jgi:hypothetical protein
MCEWIHICSDVDNVQIVAFGMHIHNSMGAKCIVLVTRIVMCDYIHICIDVDSGQEVKKVTRTFLCARNEAFN